MMAEIEFPQLRTAAVGADRATIETADYLLVEKTLQLKPFVAHCFNEGLWDSSLFFSDYNILPHVLIPFCISS